MTSKSIDQTVALFTFSACWLLTITHFDGENVIYYSLYVYQVWKSYYSKNGTKKMKSDTLRLTLDRDWRGVRRKKGPRVEKEITWDDMHVYIVQIGE